MAVDYYGLAEEIASMLVGEGLSQEAQSIRDAVAEGSTATEILMRIRFRLKSLSGRAIARQDTQQRIEALISEIDRAIPPA